MRWMRFRQRLDTSPDARRTGWHLPVASWRTLPLALLVPVFFVRMGMLVDLRSFLRADVIGFALLLTAAAIAGKLVCGLVVPKGVSRLTVGLGMMPRGEVGLIFAGIGAQLVLEGHPVVDPGTYAAAVFMVVATTLITPPLLVWSIRREARV